MILRITLTHEIEGSLILSEPEGWKDAVAGFERHPILWTLVGFYKTSFKFYGSNGVENGGRDWVKNVEKLYGPDATIDAAVEYSVDDITLDWQPMFDGQLPIIAISEILDFDHTLQLAFGPGNFWTKFVSRFETPVNIQSPTDQDGNAVPVYAPKTLQLPSQKIRYEGRYSRKENITYPEYDFGFTCYLQFEDTEVDDLKKFNIAAVPAAYGSPTDRTQIIGIFEAPHNGDYTLDVRVEHATYGGIPGGGGALGFYPFANSGQLRVQKVGSPTAEFATSVTQELRPRGGINYGYAVSQYNKKWTLLKGDQIAVYMNRSASDTFTVFGKNQRNWAADVAVATTTNVALAGLFTIDGYAISNGERILVWNQADQTQNGIYAASAGAWVRTSDTLTNAKVEVTNGTVYGGETFIQTYEDIDIGVTPVTWELAEYDDTKLDDYPGTFYFETADTHLYVTADTVFKKTDAEAFLLHDLAASVFDRIIGGSENLYSPFLGCPLNESGEYEETGGGSMYAALKGLHLRGYTLAQKQFSISGKNIWDGIDPILNLCCGYTKIGGVNKIYIGQKKDAFDDSDMSTVFYNVRKITRTHDKENYFNLVEAGYDKWNSDDVGGIDEVQTTRIWSSLFKNIGKKLSILSKWIGASLTWEQARRERAQATKDYKYDDDVFIAAVVEDDGDITPEVNEVFSDVTGIQNEDTRINKRITPARNLLRWMDYISGCLQSYLESVLKFQEGKGNYDMESTMSVTGNPEDFGGNPLSEKGEIPISEEFLFYPEPYEIETTITIDQYVAINNNRNMAIGVSQTDSDPKKCFIKDFQANLFRGTVKMIVWPKEKIDIQNIPNETVESEVPEMLGVFDDSFDDTFE